LSIKQKSAKGAPRARRKKVAGNLMADELFHKVDDWPIAKRKRVESSLVGRFHRSITQCQQIAYKLCKSAHNGELEPIPITVKRSRGNFKREVAQAKIAENRNYSTRSFASVGGKYFRLERFSQFTCALHHE
jgi:hypothetical protein